MNVTFHCNTCGGQRNHAVLTEHVHNWKEEVDFDDEDGRPLYIYGKDVYVLLRCCGCDSVSLKHESFNEDDEHSTIQAYPPRQFRKKPSWFYEDALAEFIPRLLKEIYGSLYSEHRAVSAMGIRALLELIMIEKVGDKGSFTKNVDTFEREGFISPLERELLEPVLEFAHAAMHRNHAPKMNELITALDVTESLIHTLYILPAKAQSLGEAVPKRSTNRKP